MDLLINLLDGNGLNIKKPIKDIHKSCCNSAFIVYDFDEIKDTFCKISSLKDTPKSCDCLLYNSNKKELLLVEMKNIGEAIRNKPKYIESKEQYDSFISSEFDKYKFKDKILDSLLLLLAIPGFHGIDKDYFINVLSKSQYRINFLILVDMSYEEYLTYNIIITPKLESIKFRALSGIDILISTDFDNYLKKREFS